MNYDTRAVNRAGEEQLERVTAEFDQWRQQKTKRNEKIPRRLLEEARKLSEHFKASKVCQRLGLTKAQMDNIDENNQKNGATMHPEFMRLVPHSEDANSVSPSELTVEISTPEGLKIRFSNLAQQEPLSLIAKFIEN
jgi:hypothetical protein